jgi:class 3 adenylate cyclase
VNEPPAATRCDECGSPNRLSAKFCGNCGGRLAHELACPDCETPNPAGQLYCDECGRELRASEAQASERAASVSDSDEPLATIAISSEDPSELAPVAAPDGTVTIMFSDIEASSNLAESLGDEAWFLLLRRHDRIVRRELMAHGGFEVKTQGDGFMMAFGSARSAVLCAIAIQSEFARYRSRRGDERLRVRIGLHTGEAMRDGGDFFGRNVILAARLAAEARGSEIVASGLVRELVSGTREFAFGEERELELKGLTGRHRVFRVDWAHAAALRE